MALLLFGGGAKAESTKDVLRDFGLTGTWSSDCSVDIQQPCTLVARCIGRFIFSTPLIGPATRELVAPTFQKGNVFRETVEIESATRITDDKIRIVVPGTRHLQGRLLYVLPTNGEEWEVVYVKDGNKLKLWVSQRTDGGKIAIMDGMLYQPSDSWKPEDGPVKQWIDSGKPAPTFEKCLN